MSISYRVYEIERQSTSFRDLSPEGGFETEAVARGYACSCANSRWTNSNTYAVVGENSLRGLYLGRGVPSRPDSAGGARADCDDWPNEYCEAPLAEAA